MSNSNSNSLSDVLGNIGNTDSTSASAASSSAAASSSNSGSRSGSGSGSASASVTASSSAASGSNTITDAPQIGSSSSSAAATITGAPALTSGVVLISDAPKLSGYFSYPPASVPPIANAPYMQRTSLPENFVFIIVGAVIAFVALLIIAWRVLTSWSINRRFRRHEGTVGTTARKASYTPLADFKQKPSGGAVPSSAHDMKDLGNLPRNFSSVPSLFFSPTAEVAQRNSTRPTTRDSSAQMHMPAGHYRDASRT